jgi:hypothetical protein
MASIAIVPAQHHMRRESWIIGAVTALLVLAAVGYHATIGANPGPPPLLDWQASAFADLGADDQAIHSALIVAGEEIGYMNSDFGDWPPPSELDKILLPPFYQDAFWSLHGSVRWQLIRAADFNLGGDTSYLGTGGNRPGQSAYMLLFRHRHMGGTFSNQIDIWVHRNPNAAMPAGTKAEMLVADGWRQVVVYSGADEVARLKGS